jgi:hypothetical protein
MGLICTFKYCTRGLLLSLVLRSTNYLQGLLRWVDSFEIVLTQIFIGKK